MRKMQRNLKIDRRTLMKNEVPVNKKMLERLIVKEKAFDEKRVLLYELKISTLPGGVKERKYYAVDPENLIVQQKAQLLKQDGLMKDMRTDSNKQKTVLEKELIFQKNQFKVRLAKLEARMKNERAYYRAAIVAACITIILMLIL